MEDIRTYHIEVRNGVDEKDFNTTSPIQIEVVRVEQSATLFTVSADQSGLIGLIRHLHRQGFVLMSVCGER